MSSPTACSVVVACGEGLVGTGACLGALQSQVTPHDEVLVVDDGTGNAPPAWARRVSAPGRSLVPEQWAAGLIEARSPVVALTSAAMEPGPDWLDRARRVASTPEAGLGGAIEPGVGLRHWDWALYFCRYAPYLPPLGRAAGLEVAADNAAYRADVLEGYHTRWQDGFWEPFVHRAMRADGHRLGMDADMVVRLSPGTDPSAFARQRFRHGRSHGRHRSNGQHRVFVLVAGLTAPAVPPLLAARIGRLVWAKRRYRARLVVALPAVVWFSAWWAAGELAGRIDALRAPNTRP